jgi:hypothetical protein
MLLVDIARFALMRMKMRFKDSENASFLRVTFKKGLVMNLAQVFAG